ncbi:MAG: ATP phosphoribosyltransferase regulatory subunit [Zoogloeaceae bacterium]|jgi:ATP phosphoribosyltransferase regulatory subunit|nr:ATP phosphoribosyltransferase regulatory subunit [Zoogloeaceae bacterium]
MVFRMKWLLPENLSDALPAEAMTIERLRRQLLDRFFARGYELVMPPMLEFVDSLLTGSGRELDDRTIKLVDQLSGKPIGVRADMTPQVARIDAHLLKNREGANRLCYCGSALHARPAHLYASREPMQIGAELFGLPGTGADAEILQLAVDTLGEAGIDGFLLDLGHVGILRALLGAARADGEIEPRILSALQKKDMPALEALTAALPAPWGKAVCALPNLRGDAQKTLATAQDTLPDLPEIRAALSTLAALAGVTSANLSIDLSDLRGYRYHNGVVFSAYAPGAPAPILSGGRYDGIGKGFGRDRPATGFSSDLRELARLSSLPS